MQDPKEVLRLILNTGYAEIDDLMKTEIDIPFVLQYMIEEGLEITYNRLVYEAFWNKLADLFDYDESKYKDKFYIACNGICTECCILESIHQEYREKYGEQLEELENYMYMDLAETPFI